METSEPSAKKRKDENNSVGKKQQQDEDCGGFDLAKGILTLKHFEEALMQIKPSVSEDVSVC